MRQPTLESVRVVGGPDGTELRIGFSNDRHHAVLLGRGTRVEEVCNQLGALALRLARDPHLRPPEPAYGEDCNYFTCQWDENGDIAISHCAHPGNKDDREGNCSPGQCPLDGVEEW